MAHLIPTIERISENGNLVFTNGDTLSSSKIKHKISVGVMKSLDLTPGDKILITANNQEYGLTNGDTATIKAISPDGEILLDDDRTVPADFDENSALFGQFFATIPKVRQTARKINIDKLEEKLYF